MEEMKTFRQAYGVLQEHAQTLRDQTEPNIDALLSIVTESVAAYKVCKERIDAVETALQEALTGAGVEVGGRDTALTSIAPLNPHQSDGGPSKSGKGGVSTVKVSGIAGFDNMDDDIPF